MKALLMMLALSLCLAPATGQGGGGGLPGDSLYQLQDVFTDDHGLDFQLDRHRGRPVMVAMFYTGCTYTCPLIVDALKRAERSLDPAAAGSVDVLLLTLDHAVDTPELLGQTRLVHGIEAGNWTLARTGEAGVRRIAALLGVRYRPLSGGGFNHTSNISLLDAEGRVIARTGIEGPLAPAFLEALREASAPR